jgi:hypothetical protein
VEREGQEDEEQHDECCSYRGRSFYLYLVNRSTGRHCGRMIFVMVAKAAVVTSDVHVDCRM